MIIIKGYSVSFDNGVISVSTLGIGGKGEENVETWYFSKDGKKRGYGIKNPSCEWDSTQLPKIGQAPPPPDDALAAVKIFIKQHLPTYS